MPRSAAKPDDLASITARREALKAELAALDERAKALELASRDAGRPILIAALEKVKIAAMDKADAKAIAAALEQHGGKVLADHLRALPAA
jgi:hypothetical protein